MSDRDDEPPLLSDARLLALLDPDPATAAAFVRKLQADLSRTLEMAGCRDASEASAAAISRGLKAVLEGRIGRAEFRPWVFGIGRNIAREMRDDDWRHVQYEHATDIRAAHDYRPEDEIHARRMLALARTLLPAEQWALLERYSTEDEHEKQARELGISTAAFRVRIHHIRVMLKGLIEAAVRAGKLRNL